MPAELEKNAIAYRCDRPPLDLRGQRQEVGADAAVDEERGVSQQLQGPFGHPIAANRADEVATVHELRVLGRWANGQGRCAMAVGECSIWAVPTRGGASGQHSGAEC